MSRLVVFCLVFTTASLGCGRTTVSSDGQQDEGSSEPRSTDGAGGSREVGDGDEMTLPPAYNAPGAPQVTQILSLPNDSVVVEPFEVTCQIEPSRESNAFPVDLQSYRVAVVDTDGFQLFTVVPDESVSKDEFTVTVPLESLDAGEYFSERH